MHPIASKPRRHPLLSEQTLLTFSAATGGWEIVHLEFDELLDIDVFKIGISHWIDLADLLPAFDPCRQALWEEEAESTFRDAGLTSVSLD